MKNNHREAQSTKREGEIESSFSLSSLCSPCLCGEIFWEEGIVGSEMLMDTGRVDWLVLNLFRPDTQEKKAAISYVEHAASLLKADSTDCEAQETFK